MIQVCLLIELLYPEANEKNYTVEIDPDYNWEITIWNLPHTKPSKEELESKWEIYKNEIMEDPRVLS